MEIAGYDLGKNAYNYLRWFFLWVKNQLILNAFVLACLESVSTLEFERKLEREGKRGINRRLEGKGKALPLLLCPSCSFISLMTLLFPFLLAFSPAETLATQPYRLYFFGYNRPQNSFFLSSFLSLANWSKRNKPYIKKKNKKKSKRRFCLVTDQKERQNFIPAKFCPAD